MKKRLFAGLLAAVMMLSLLPTSAFAAEETDSAASDTEQTETLQPSKNTTDVQDVSDTELPTVAPTSSESSLSVTDFSFYGVRTGNDGYYNETSTENPTQLVLEDGEYVIYAPLT